MTQVVLIRHGESEWNKENRFTGWTDVDLTAKGRQEAEAAGELLLKEGYDFDQVYTSVLKRAIRTLWLILDKMDRMWLPVERSWRLNERHYGALQGLNKVETVEKHGAEQVQIWRRSYATPPPPLTEGDQRHPGHDSKYRNLLKDELPASESLKDTVARFVPYWEETIWPQVKKGKRVMIVAHGNSLRALLKHVENISEEDIVELNIPTGIPMVLEFNDQGQFAQRYYLGDAEAAARAAEAVAHQTSTRK